MKNDFSELIEYLDDKFNEVNGKVDGLTETVTTLKTSVDSIALDKKITTDKILVLDHRMKKAEDFIDQAAPKLDLEFRH